MRCSPSRIVLLASTFAYLAWVRYTIEGLEVALTLAAIGVTITLALCWPALADRRKRALTPEPAPGDAEGSAQPSPPAPELSTGGAQARSDEEEGEEGASGDTEPSSADAATPGESGGESAAEVVVPLVWESLPSEPQRGPMNALCVGILMCALTLWAPQLHDDFDSARVVAFLIGLTLVGFGLKGILRWAASHYTPALVLFQLFSLAAPYAFKAMYVLLMLVTLALFDGATSDCNIIAR